MKINKFLSIIFFMMAISVGMVFSGGSVDSPKSHAGVEGNYSINISIEDPASGYNNASAYYSQQSGDPTLVTTWTLIGSVENSTQEQTVFEIGLSSTTLTDGPIIFNWTLSEDVTGAIINSSNVSIGNDVDNTLPTGTYGTGTPSNTTFKDVNNVTINMASDNSVTNCTLSITPNPVGNTTNEATASGGLCGFNLRNIPEGIYTYNLTTLDGLNTTIFGTQTFTIDTVATGGAVAVIEAQAQETQKSNVTNIVVFFIVLFVLYLMFFSGKGR